MKKIIIAALAAIVGAGLYAQTMKARVDVSGRGVPLKPVSGPEKGYLRNIHWGKKENRKFALICETSALPEGKWVKMSFAFIPEKDGKLSINLMGPWNRSKGKKNLNACWIYYDMITVEGATIKNGDFEAVSKKGGAASWSCSKEQYVTSGTDFVSGKAAVKAWHNKRCTQVVNVKKGQKVTITVNVKAAEFVPSKK